MKLVLVNPPANINRIWGALAAVAAVRPPLGLVALAAYARAHGIEVSIVDATAQQLDMAGTVRMVLAANPDVVGLTASTGVVTRAAAVADSLRVVAPQLPVLIGGPHATALPSRTLTEFPGFTAAVFGEGEETLVETCRKLEHRASLDDVAGLAWRDGPRVVVNPARPVIADLDSLPLPAWELLPNLTRSYQPSPLEFRRLPTMDIVASRGCPFGCSFCSLQNQWGQTHRSQSSAAVVATALELQRRYGIRDIAFHDANFGLEPGFLADFADQLLRERVRLSWSFGARGDLSDVSLLRLLKRAGCWSIRFGIESGSQRVLDFIHKRMTLESLDKAVRAANSAGIVAVGNAIVGLPSETAESLAETQRFLLDLALDRLFVTHFVPYPGTEDWERAAELGDVAPGWDALSFHQPSFVPRGLTREELVAARRRIVLRFYLRPRMFAIAAALASTPRGSRILARGVWALGRLGVER